MGSNHTLPCLYKVGKNNDAPSVMLGAPAVRAIGVEPGDKVMVKESEDGVLVERVE